MQTKVLLSIKPEYADKIFAGSKRFEFRRRIFKSPKVKTVVVYSSSPVKEVIGEFEVKRILKQTKSDLWKSTSQHAGIQKDYFDKYFGDLESGYAIEISNPKRYHRPKKLNKVCNSDFPPQSFRYL